MDRREAWEAHKPNKAAAARACGIARSTFSEWLAKETAGEAPVDPFIVTGRSTLTDAEGNVKLVWEKTALDRQATLDALQAAVEGMAADLPRLPPLPAPFIGRAELATVYTLTDCHVGMLAWRKEGGEDWDLSIAEKTLVGCFEAMIEAAPPSDLGVVNQLGDFLHFDGLSAVTPTSGHILDADGRFGNWSKPQSVSFVM